ncbi:Lrp/AsnC family transcriptional regulator [Streptomyces mirabilis]|uniref:Lrp/AsnC family transcriptional regulator n=1 Tax=Streptomyces mirabilis TaxID=68239 RepID=UPI0037143925
MCAMKPRSRQARDELLFDRLQRTPRVVSVSAHCVLHSFYGGRLDWLNKANGLAPDQQAALRPPPVEPVTDPLTLEAADEALLAVLVRDGRASLTELQAATGQSESVVKRRLERMRATGVLYFDVQFDQEPLGHEVEAMLGSPWPRPPSPTSDGHSPRIPRCVSPRRSPARPASSPRPSTATARSCTRI